MNAFEIYVQRYNGKLPTEFDPNFLEILQMGKYRVLATPDVSPGKCANCGASKDDGRGYADFGLQVDWYGAVFLCGYCLRDVATAVGLFKEYLDKIDSYQAQVVSLQNLIMQADSMHNYIVETLKKFEELYANLHAVSPSSSSDNSANVESYTSPVGSPSVDGNKSNADGSKPGTTKSTSSAGRKNVSSLADLLDAAKQ